MKYINKIMMLLLSITGMAHAMEVDQPKFEFYAKSGPVWIALADKNGEPIELNTGELYEREAKLIGHKDNKIDNFEDRITKNSVKFTNEKGDQETKDFEYIKINQNEKYRHDTPIGQLVITARPKNEHFVETVTFYEFNPGVREDDIYLTYKTIDGKPSIKPQSGTMAGLSGESDSGFSLANNIHMDKEYHGKRYMNTDYVTIIPYGVRDFRPFGNLEYSDKFFDFIATGTLRGSLDIKVPGTKKEIMKEWDKMNQTEKQRAVKNYWTDEIKQHINKLVQLYGGFTPLHIATWFGQFSVVRQLVKTEKVPTNTRDINDMTAEDISAKQTARMNEKNIYTPHAENIRNIQAGLARSQW